ncbi:response regulator [Methanospirillum lacunae]|uniref:Response regulator n=1 Tax=Methanospirillum lacunae TaxID=668570 RepID=A0A2V2NE29_9EURY|nr:response regulator [Methanospirillum lacunae]PWR74678.1 response regulator [Methanospirillum lacunae]
MTHRILLLDDEPAICEITSILLKKLGYDAVITSKGEDSIEAYRAALDQGARFDVVILDLSVPGGPGGKEVIAALLEMDPKVKALVSSGDANDPAVSRFRDFGFTGVLMKPYTKAVLDETIKKVISPE